MDASSSPQVSVIVATYRCDQFLRLALASILAQTFGDFEVLVADDGADDGTRAVAASFGDSRLVYYRNPERLGAAGNHWAAIRRARGEYVAILNHDDLWQPTFLARMLAGFADPRVVVAFSDFAIIDPEGCLLPEETAKLSQHTRRATLRGGVHLPFSELAITPSIPTAQAAVFKKSALDLDDLIEEAGPSYDLWLNFLLARGGGGAFYVPEPLASWRTHAASISRTTNTFARPEWPACTGICYVRMAAHPSFAAQRSHIERLAAHCFVTAALSCLRGGLPSRTARAYAFQALRQTLPSLRTLLVTGMTLLPRPGQRLAVWVLALPPVARLARSPTPPVPGL